MIKLLTLALLAAIASVSLGSTAFAGTASSTFTVTANVVKNCSINAANINFGSYDPVVANATTALNMPSTVTVACTKSTAATVVINAGSNFAGSGCAGLTTRAMSAGGGNFLCYDIYQPGAGNVSATTQVWGTAGAAIYNYTAASKAPVGLVDTGQIPPGQDVAALTYNDSVIATINF
ncbi:MAG: spore coat protein U domain-containing protein [Candidatus Eremiobacteraeota bacterium]|nr:spore coat protein U domain-containing protein [Candidatus Eremiobacteraeota bacterium]